jgi:hypothetical protein
VIQALGKLFAGPKLQLDTIFEVAFPGNPANDNFEDYLPDHTKAIILSTGIVTHPPVLSEDGKMHTFDITVSEYVRDSRKSFLLRFVSFYIFLYLYLVSFNHMCSCIYNV